MVPSPSMKRCVSCKAMTRDDAESCVRCNGTRLVPTTADVVDDRYALDYRLGEGAMGVVYLAHDVDLGRTVALKLVAKSGDATRRDAIRREAAALAAIRHPHVVQVFDFGAHGDSFFFAMEYVHGRPVDELLADFRAHRAFVPVHRALTIALQTAGGLGAAHAAGIVHRDVKPSNVVIEQRSGRPVLVDFGLAHRLALGDSSEIVGTPTYMAPEQSLARPIGPPADVYGLGCTVFELLTGRPPFLGETAAELLRMHALEPAPTLSSLRPELAPLDAVLARALAKTPESRYATCEAFRDALEAVGERWLTTSSPPPSLSLTPRPSDHIEVEGAIRILVVDDDEDFRRFAKRAAQLSMLGVYLSVSAVASGHEAIASARRRPPQLVILDYDMPDLDGLATLSALRALPSGADARVVVVSGRTKAEERWRFGMLGVQDFVDKPVQLADLVGTLMAIAERDGWAKARPTTATSG